jgi:pimeloyl-ACP methyl ester carboxylesterase
MVDLYLRWDANAPYPGYTECFANGVDPKDAAVLHAAQRPGAAVQFVEPSGPPAWKTIPSWSLIGTLDHVIPLALQEEMSSRADAHISRVEAGHLSLITHPAEVTEVILSAVDATTRSERSDVVAAGAMGS